MPSDGTGSRQYLIAHRCRGFGHPENSLRAVREALHSSVDAIEVDVRLTKDDKWVVVHNPHASFEGSQARRVRDRALSQLRREVAPLDSVLALFSAFGDGKDLFIDVKDVGEERSLLRLLERHGVADCTIVIAWEQEVLRRVHKLAPSQRIGLSYVPLHHALKRVSGAIKPPSSQHRLLWLFNDPHRFDPATAVGHTHQHYLSEIPQLPLFSIQVPGLFCSRRLVRSAHARGIKVYPFLIADLGVNSRFAASMLRRRGVDGLLVDAPRS